MGYFIVMYVMTLCIPVVMIIAGYMMDRHTPKKINGVYGYRTARSMKNKETWEFAQHYCGKLWLKIGVVLLVISAFMLLPFVHRSHDVISAAVCIAEAVQVAVLVASIFPTERALKKNFDEKGNRRSSEE